MRSHLKVKVYSLSKEMTYIRRQEEKWKTRARIARQRQKQASVEYAEKNFWTQRGHRYQLKRDARTAHLAYGFMKGVPYSKMEPICYGVLKGFGSSPPDWAGIAGTVERFMKDELFPQSIMQRYAEWLSDAKTWYDGNEDRIPQIQELNREAHEERRNDPVFQEARREQSAMFEACNRARKAAAA